MNDERHVIELTPAGKPAYRNKHPCPSCDTGYLDCAALSTANAKCCTDCAHPTRWTTSPPYTAEEIAHMNTRRQLITPQQP